MNENPYYHQNNRFIALQQWVSKVLNCVEISIEPLTNDASFRRYFRVYAKQQSWVVMDAPPDKESCEPFAAIATAWRKLNIKVPEILAADFKGGFLLLSDFGDDLYLTALNEQTADRLYHIAFDSLIDIQQCQNVSDYKLPIFDRSIYWQEMHLFTDWYLPHLRNILLNSDEVKLYQHIGDLLIEAALAQPQVCVHRDYHSRNLMVLPNEHVGVLDFQDALWGPMTYDLMSLLRDCYIDWPQKRIDAWIEHYYQQCIDRHLLNHNVSLQQFQQWFDWITLQRNLKCIGIFTRLAVRDGKKSYLNYIPRVLGYALGVCDRYEKLKKLVPILQK